MNDINMLTFLGSSRKDGNMEILLKKFLKGAQMAAADIVVLTSPIFFYGVTGFSYPEVLPCKI